MGRSARAVDAERWSHFDPELASAFVAQLEHERHQTAELRLLAETGPAMAFVRALEARCGDTAGHSDRIAQTSEMIAARLEVPDEQVKGIAMAARLHDIGKVGVPDRVLNKPGSLTAEELVEMRKHPGYARDVIVRAQQDAGAIDDEILAMAKDIVYTHHEKWDGTGYPQGLRGAQIPIVGRVMALVDVYDAIMTRRAYQAPMSHDEAVATIISGRGTHFDPDVVDAFMKVSDGLRRLSADGDR